jgi:hypothetical protein
MVAGLMRGRNYSSQMLSLLSLLYHGKLVMLEISMRHINFTNPRFKATNISDMLAAHTCTPNGSFRIITDTLLFTNEAQETKTSK